MQTVIVERLDDPEERLCGRRGNDGTPHRGPNEHHSLWGDTQAGHERL